MAIAVNPLTSGGSTSVTSSFTTASITPGTDRLILVAIGSRRSGGSPNTPTLSGNGLTWTQVDSVQESIAWNRISLFRALGTTTTTGTITIDFAGINQVACTWSVAEFTGVNKTGTNGAGAIVQEVTNTGVSVTSLTMTLGAFTSPQNAAYGCMVSEVNQSTVAGAGFAIIHDNPVLDNTSATEWKVNNDTTVDLSWSSGSRVAGIGLEIAASHNAPQNSFRYVSVGDGMSRSEGAT